MGENIKQSAKAAARAVTDAGEKVSSEIQGKLIDLIGLWNARWKHDALTGC